VGALRRHVNGGRESPFYLAPANIWLRPRKMPLGTHAERLWKYSLYAANTDHALWYVLGQPSSLLFGDRTVVRPGVVAVPAGPSTFRVNSDVNSLH
jgi:hypothetical protein